MLEAISEKFNEFSFSVNSSSNFKKGMIYKIFKSKVHYLISNTFIVLFFQKKKEVHNSLKAYWCVVVAVHSILIKTLIIWGGNFILSAEKYNNTAILILWHLSKNLSKHYGCFWEILSKKYLRQISILGAIK